jgi:hypothetical protein
MLNTDNKEIIADGLIDALLDMGYEDPLEAIPGLVEAIGLLAKGDSVLLDEASDLLADL